MVGTFVGSAADRYGRKNSVLLFGILYGAACVLKHWGQLWVLILGRFLSGIATSILYSAFESWMVSQHHAVCLVFVVVSLSLLRIPQSDQCE